MSDAKISNYSEIGPLNTVIIHQPGPEMENMTPETAHEVLYDDILTLDLALKEHAQLSGVLKKVTKNVFEFSGLLADVLEDSKVKLDLLQDVCSLHGHNELVDDLMAFDAKDLSAQLFQGTLLKKNTLERYLSPSRHAIPPLPNAFFTRDAVMCVYDKPIIGSMAHRVRLTEALLLKSIFNNHPMLKGQGFHLDGTQRQSEELTIEGGDLLVIRDDLLVIGYSERTSARAIDRLAGKLSLGRENLDIVVVELPKIRATIHLDMIFTMLDVDTVMNFPPLITGAGKCKAFHISCTNGKINYINEYSGLPKALRNFGLELNFVNCGGDNPFSQEREQWTSGANFFTFAPGHIIGYKHNKATMEALDQAGFAIIDANDIISGAQAMPAGKAAVAMDGSELSRGGGGCRCMTMPVHREAVDW
ncbi:arginine deiminase family protein [Marinicella meishanensis]|uniref:arginine deiminase n=1 Tax=Marinicella meishanensis TaxID=2873263 RepID=UPI001CBBBB1A|nr:arginine deiminase family protein [Marinicella sp. NBU2979]